MKAIRQSYHFLTYLLALLVPCSLFLSCDISRRRTVVSVRGRVLDTAGIAVAGAEAVFQSRPVAIVTGSDGTFEVRLWSGNHQLAITAGNRQIYNHQVAIPAGRQFDLGDISPDTAFFQSRLTLREQGQFDYRYDYRQWCAVSVADSNGMAVTGLGYDDFEITETMVRISDGQVVAREVIPLEEQFQRWRQTYDLGLFERSVSSEKLDIVFLTDYTGSFDDDGTDVRGEVKRFVERLLAEHVDFRIAGVGFQETPDIPNNFEFYGPEKADLIPDEIDSVLRTAGDWWDPTCAYDALLFTPYFGFRPDARRVAVLLTDIVPQTVYGTFWYSLSATIATRSAAEKFCFDHGIELFYAVFEHPAPDIEYYWQADKNPRAGENGSPKYGIEGSGLGELRWAGDRRALQLTWPFTADELWEKLALSRFPVRDSWYMMTWFPVIDRDDLSGGLDRYLYRVSIGVRNAENTVNVPSVSYEKPASHPTVTAKIQLVDEEGSPFVEAWSWLYVERAGRATEHIYHQVGPDETGTLVFKDLVPQRYMLLVTDGSPLPYGFASLRAIARLNFDVTAEGANLRLVVHTAERAADEAAMGGLLHDLESWRLSGSPYRRITGEIKDWMYDCDSGAGRGILCDGLNWREQAALRHLILVLGGYGNLNEYSQLEAQRALEDFQNIVTQVGLLVDEIQELRHATETSWKGALASVGFRAALDFATTGQAEVLISTVNGLITRLANYLADAFFDELVDLLQRKIIDVAGIDPNHPVALMIEAGVALYQHWDASGNDREQNLGLIWDMVQKLSLHLVLEQTIDALFPETVRDSFDAVPSATALEKAVKPLLKELAQATWDGAQLVNFDQRLKAWSASTAQMLSSHDREEILLAVDAIFDKWTELLEQRGVPEIYPDFVLSFLRELAMMAVPELQTGIVVLSPSRDEVIRVLLRHAVYNVFVRDRFVDEFQAALTDSLARVQAIATTPADDFDRWEWRGRTYHTLFRNFRSAIGSAQDVAWNALEKQREIRLWAEGLAELQVILTPLGGALDVAAAVYYPLQDAADAVHAFSATLDSIQIVVTAVEFGLKLKGLEDLGDLSETTYRQAFE